MMKYQKEVKETVPFTPTSKRTYLGINLMRQKICSQKSAGFRGKLSRCRKNINASGPGRNASPFKWCEVNCFDGEIFKIQL